jgi:DNA mismatch endonuclease, patch repair protein
MIGRANRRGFHVDIVTPDKRSVLMSGIRSKNTRPEIAVRRVAHSLGYRFRLHRRDLPGHPDIVFPSLKKIVLVHGCFWHRHLKCKYAYCPKSNVDFWEAKFAKTLERDSRNIDKLERLGWRLLTVWECETSEPEALRKLVKRFLDGPRSDNS